MKKLLIFLPVMFVVSLIFAKTMFFNSNAQLVNKEISFSVFSNADYHAPAYDSSLAQVDVTVTKISGNSSIVLLSKHFDAMQLKDYTKAGSAKTQNISMPQVMGDKDYLIVSYTVTYNTKGSIVTLERQDVMDKGIDKKHVDIEI